LLVCSPQRRIRPQKLFLGALITAEVPAAIDMIQRGTKPHAASAYRHGKRNMLRSRPQYNRVKPCRPHKSALLPRGGQADGGLRGLHGPRDSGIGSGPMGRRWQGRWAPSPEKQPGIVRATGASRKWVAKTEGCRLTTVPKPHHRARVPMGLSRNCPQQTKCLLPGPLEMMVSV
jgi:hypothetical protein